jgi:hypothetical protein
MIMQPAIHLPLLSANVESATCCFYCPVKFGRPTLDGRKIKKIVQEKRGKFRD